MKNLHPFLLLKQVPNGEGGVERHELLISHFLANYNKQTGV